MIVDVLIEFLIMKSWFVDVSIFFRLFIGVFFIKDRINNDGDRSEKDIEQLVRINIIDYHSRKVRVGSINNHS